MFYPRAFFQQRIKEERFRTYRTGSPFSVVFFSPFKLFAAGSKNKKRAIQKIVEFVDQDARETDIKGWWDGRTIAILLPDSKRGDALVLVDRLFSRIQTMNLELVKSAEEASFEIYTFPNTRYLETSLNDEREEEDSKIPKHKSTQNSPQMDFSTTPLNQNSIIQNGFKKYEELMKRCFDIIVSLIGLIMSSPLFLLCAVLIKLESPGPVFYRQTRVGMGGKLFTFLKFRSMYHNSDEEIHKNHVENLMNGRVGLSRDGRRGETSYKLTEDKRITRIGRFLRRTSIDELPQLINVIKGDMTLVGPRPHPVYEVVQYSPWQGHRLDVKPGVTGLGQVFGRSGTEYEDVYRLDLRYLKKNSLLLDIDILFRTLHVVLSGRGAR